MSKKKSKDKSKSKGNPKKAADEPKAKAKGKSKGKEVAAPAAKRSKKASKPSAERTLATQPSTELEVLDDVEREALEAYQRVVAENRARKEQVEEPEAIIEADSWQFDMDNSTFSLQREAKTVAELELDEDSMRTLVQGLNSAYILPDDEPPAYQVRIPDLYDAPPVLSLIKGGVVVGALALDADFNESVGPLLRARYPEKPQEPAWSTFKAWVKSHKIRTGLLALLAIPVLVLLVEGAYNSIVGSFN